MPDRKFLLRTEVLGTVTLGGNEEAEKRELTKIIEDGNRWDQDRTGWLDRQSMLTRLRYGIRRPKTFPWRNASNLAIPLIDAQIRKFKPLLMRLIVEADPIVEFVGEDPEAVDSERIAEAEYNWLFKTEMNAVESMAYVIDSIAHRGYGIAQVGWDYQTEYECRVLDVASTFGPQGPPQDDQALLAVLARGYGLYPDDPAIQRALAPAIQKIRAGEPQVKIAFPHVIKDRPAVWDRDPVQVIAPPRTTDYGNANRIIVQHLLPIRQCKQMEADGFFLKGSVAKILGSLGKKGQTGNTGDVLGPDSQGMMQDQRQRDELERIWGMEDEEQILLWEVYHWTEKGDKMADRVVTYLHPRSLTKLSCRPYPYPFRRWPFVKFDFEKTSRRFHGSRGISAMLEGIQREVNHQHNARLDAMTLRNAPVYQSPALAGFKARNFRAVPGTIIQQPMGGRIEPLVQDRGAWPEQVNEENMLRGMAEDYIGAFDSAITGPRGGADRRTATEVNASVQLAASTASMDTILFQLSMKELHTMLWELWVDLRPAEVSFKVTGVDPETRRPPAQGQAMPNEPQLVTVPKSEIDKKFKLYPTGTIANTSRALELQNAQQALAAFANDQTGFINGHELRKWYLSLLDFRRARKIVNSPEQAAELVTLRQAAATLQQDPQLLAQMGGRVAEPANIPEAATPTDVDAYAQ